MRTHTHTYTNDAKYHLPNKQVLLGLRKHEGAPANVSRSRRKEQDAAALNAVAMAMSRVLDQAGRRRNVTPMQASAVRSPETTASADELAEGARLLGELEEAVLDKGRKVSVHKVSKAWGGGGGGGGGRGWEGRRFEPRPEHARAAALCALYFVVMRHCERMKIDVEGRLLPLARDSFVMHAVCV